MNDIRGTSKSSWGTGHVTTGNKLIMELNKEMTGSNMRRTKKVLKKDRLYLIQDYFLERMSVACPLKAE